MNDRFEPGPADETRSDRFFLLLLLFAASGCAALIYEVVWFDLLELVIGSSAISIGVLLAAYMGGLCAGSLSLPRFVPARAHPLRVYALLEIGIGVFGLLILFGLPYAAGLYAAVGGEGAAGLLFRGMLGAVCLLPPTLLMGATLPAIARRVGATPTGVSRLGFLYGANTAGAVAGSLLAGFYLLRVHDVAVATWVAVGINVLAASGAFLLSAVVPHTLHTEESGKTAVDAGGLSAAVLLTIALSGATALAAEVVWTRLLSLVLGATVYAFALILAVFLLGLGAGSGAGSFFARRVANPRTALGWCQGLLVAGIAWGGYSIVEILPYWQPGTAWAGAIFGKFIVDFLKCSCAVLPAASLWGASFPLALSGAARSGQDPGRLAGAVYAANTAGAITGALATSLWFIAWVGTPGAQRIMIVLAAAGAALMLAPVAPVRAGALAPRFRAACRLAAIVSLAAVAVRTTPPVPALLVAYGRNAAQFAGVHGDFLYVGEGMNSSMAVSRQPNGILMYHNAGKVQASSEPRDMGLQRMLGHLTTLVPEHPRSVLVIGCGAGVTAGAVSIDPAVERVTIAEIERLVPRVVARYFGRQNFDVMSNPKVRLEIDDARHFVSTSGEKFDAITSDPFDPWVKGAAMLYTREFFELLKCHLKPGGVVTVFVQLYQSNVAAVKSEFATFFDLFPDSTIWVNTTEEGEGYDLVLMGRLDSTRIDLDAIARRLSRPEYAEVRRSLREIFFFSAEDLFATFGGTASGLKPWLQDAQVNRDRNLRLQYLAGLGLDVYQQDAIYREILSYRQFPDALFTGTPERLAALRAKMEAYR